MNSLSSTPLVIVGTSHFATLMAHYIDAYTDHRLLAYSVNRAYMTGPTYNDLPVIPLEELADHFDANSVKVLVAIGYTKLNNLRAEMIKKVERLGFTLTNFVSPRAQIESHIPCNQNIIILSNAMIEPFVTLGKGAIIWGGAQIAHNVTLGDNCYLAPKALICGHTTVGNKCFIGASSVIRNNIEIGDNSLIAMNATVSSSIAPQTLVKSHSAQPMSLADLHAVKI